MLNKFGETRKTKQVTDRAIKVKSMVTPFKLYCLSNKYNKLTLNKAVIITPDTSSQKGSRVFICIPKKIRELIIKELLIKTIAMSNVPHGNRDFLHIKKTPITPMMFSTAIEMSVLYLITGSLINNNEVTNRSKAIAYICHTRGIPALLIFLVNPEYFILIVFIF